MGWDGSGPQEPTTARQSLAPPDVFTRFSRPNRQRKRGGRRRITAFVRPAKRSESPASPDLAEALETFADHVLDQVANAVAVTPLVVVPADQLEEPLVQLDARAAVKD